MHSKSPSVGYLKLVGGGVLTKVAISRNKAVTS